MIFVALFPCAYVQLGTKYPKAGMVCIVSICVVALSTELDTVPGTFDSGLSASQADRDFRDTD